MKTSTGNPTKREQARIERMLRLGCIACAAIGKPNHHCLEVHHILSGNVRMGHWFTLPLCRGHHQGDWTLAQKVLLDPEDRVSISGGRKSFAEICGTEKQLWQTVQAKLELEAEWPVSKRVSRAA